jgi:hypothetical protein
VDWVQLTAMVACMTSTPLPDVWDMTVGQLIRYAACLKVLGRMTNAAMTLFDQEPGEKPEGTYIGGKLISDPSQLLAALQVMR